MALKTKSWDRFDVVEGPKEDLCFVSHPVSSCDAEINIWSGLHMLIVERN